MSNNNELQTDEYLIEITKSGPQIIDSKKSYFLFDKKTIAKSPRRQSMPTINKIQINKIKDVKIDPILVNIEQKITDHIKNNGGFDNLMDDPEINKYINK